MSAAARTRAPTCAEEARGGEAVASAPTHDIVPPMKWHERECVRTAMRAVVFQRFGGPEVPARTVLESLWTPLWRGRRVVGGMSVEKHDALSFVRELLEDDALRVVIDRRFSLEHIVEAHRVVDTGHKRVNVAITMDTAS